MDLTGAVRKIGDDNLSGSQTLTRRAAALVDEWLAEAPPEPDGMESGLLELGAAIIGAHPVMAPLRNLLQALLRDHGATLKRVADHLIANETVEGEALQELFRGQDGGLADPTPAG